jgi:hypothetical protein
VGSFSFPATAAPTGANLLTACENSLVKGFSEEQGMFCTWYVTPCDCNHGKGSEIPRVCLPETIATETLAREVITGLQEYPELQEKNAEYAAAFILSRIYPCIE